MGGTGLRCRAGRAGEPAAQRGNRAERPEGGGGVHRARSERPRHHHPPDGGAGDRIPLITGIGKDIAVVDLLSLRFLSPELKPVRFRFVALLVGDAYGLRDITKLL